jgi:hypothetical protein|tara:strand:- start:19 stop:963 length:945 start_codon:yes stop_codon:yes gene_type:complete
MPRRSNPKEIKETNLPINPSRLEDIDFAMFNYLNESLDIHCDTNKGFKKVPIIFSTQERAHMTKFNQDLRTGGTLIYPLISLERTSVDKDPANRGIYMANVPEINDEKGGAITIARRVMQSKTSLRANADSIRRSLSGADRNVKTSPRSNKKIVYEVISIPQPVYITVSYTISITTEYIQQMNQVLAPIIADRGATNSFMISHEGNRYEAFVDSSFAQTNNAASLNEDERLFKTDVTINVLGYIVGSDKNQDKPNLVIRESAAEIVFQNERALLDEEVEFIQRVELESGVFRLADQARASKKIIPRKIKPFGKP